MRYVSTTVGVDVERLCEECMPIVVALGDHSLTLADNQTINVSKHQPSGPPFINGRIHSKQLEVAYLGFVINGGCFVVVNFDRSRCGCL
jgi:hypothetical protein